MEDAWNEVILNGEHPSDSCGITIAGKALFIPYVNWSR